jgi:putative addiction module component (TIGR02574 family)
MDAVLVQEETGIICLQTEGVMPQSAVLLHRGEVMEHTMISEPAGFRELSKAEQIRYLQALWDRVAQRPGEIPVLASHIELAEERLAEYRRDPSQARPAHNVFDRLVKRVKV